LFAGTRNPSSGHWASAAAKEALANATLSLSAWQTRLAAEE
jgi:hypothetical protein